MPVYRTGPDVSFDDLIASIEEKGEKIVQILPRQGRDSFIVVTEVPVNDTGRPWAPTTSLGQTESRQA